MSSEMIKAVDGATSTTALAIKACATALPTKAEGYVDLTNRDARAVRIKFGGTAAANKDFGYQVNVWRRRGDLVGAATATYYDPEEVAEGLVTLGAKTYTDNGTHYEADTITQTLTTQPDVIVFSPADNRTAWLVVACPDVLGVQVIIDRDAGGGTAAATCDAFVQVLQEGDFFPFELLALVNASLGARTATADTAHAKLGAYTGPVAGTAADDNVKAHLDIVDTVVDMLTTNLALVSGYTIYDGWRVAQKVIEANPGTTPGTALFTVTSSGGGTAVELQIFGVVGATITGTLAETLTVKTEDGSVLIAATTATDLVAGEIWDDASPTTTVELSSAVPTYVVATPAGNDVVFLEQSGADPWDTGGITFYCRWRPIFPGIAVAASA